MIQRHAQNTPILIQFPNRLRMEKASPIAEDAQRTVFLTLLADITQHFNLQAWATCKVVRRSDEPGSDRIPAIHGSELSQFLDHCSALGLQHYVNAIIPKLGQDAQQAHLQDLEFVYISAPGNIIPLSTDILIY